jgi:7-keto-8-aminopelargonate synthetase-like enzyme
MARMEDEERLAAVEARLRAILEPYRGRLEEGQIYGVTVLRRPGAKAHDWFAGIQPVKDAVKFNLLPMHGHPEILEETSTALRRYKTGASVLKFTAIDEAAIAELEALVARAFDVYEGPRR